MCPRCVWGSGKVCVMAGRVGGGMKRTIGFKRGCVVVGRCCMGPEQLLGDVEE
jgi:hypothetical protein